jgi:hypothetical protein
VLLLDDCPHVGHEVPQLGQDEEEREELDDVLELLVV